ncbi:MAG: ABC transporter permease [Clostridiales Family XIII bacterium]|jgi:putative ABC transport system permease protein|nr:ABC transporter permease [Clostridiales Family XIII bacterium]
MNFGDNISQAFTSLRANKMRALLTMLGIIIGIAAVIAIMTVGSSMQNSISDQMQSLGVNNITVYIQQKDDGWGRGGPGMMGAFPGQQQGPGEDDLITNEMLTALREEYPDEIQAYSLSVDVGSGSTTAGSKYAYISIMGANSEYMTANNIDITRGRFVNDQDSDGRRKVAVVSDKLVSSMFGEEDPIGKTIMAVTDSHVGTYTIVGVYQTESSDFGPTTTSDADTQTEMYIPLGTAQKIMGTDGYQMFTIMSATSVNATTFSEQVQSALGKYYSRNEEYEVSTFSMESMVETVTSMLSQVTLAISAIAAIALLVGGIGVMNIMLVSITERTREIGVRKALGATNGEIRAQFIVEAIVICFIGGIIGIILGIILGMIGVQVINSMSSGEGGDMSYGTSVSVNAILLATGFSMAIGLFFGYYPANKAAKLDPIDALRFE